MNGATLDGEVDPVERDGVAVALGQACGTDREFGRGHGSSC